MSLSNIQNKAFTWTRDALIPILRQGPVPQHIAFIKDGNRRWAKAQSLPTSQGHFSGWDALERTMESCYLLGVQAVTVYAFSIDNFNRQLAEIENAYESMQAASGDFIQA